MADQLTPFERASLTLQLRRTFLYTENSGKTTTLYNFSNAGGNSSYSFGLIQFDVKTNNSNVQVFLKSIGFTSGEVALLSSRGPIDSSTMSSLNAKLQANKAAIDAFTDKAIDTKVSKLNDLITEVEGVRPDVAASIRGDVGLQIRLLDFDNQFGIGGVDAKGHIAEDIRDGFLVYLKGERVTPPGGKGTVQLPTEGGLSADDINNYIGVTKQAKDHPGDITRRASDLEKALKDLHLSSGDAEGDLGGSNLVGLEDGQENFSDSFYGDSQEIDIPNVANGYMPNGTVDSVKADLEAKGFTVEVTDTAVFAQKGDEYMIISDGMLEVGKGDQYARIALVDNEVLVTSYKGLPDFGEETVTAVYRSSGQLLKETQTTVSANHVVVKEFDGSNALIETTQTEVQANNITLTSVYDGSNKLTSQTRTEVFYDDNGEQSRIDTVTTASGTVRNVYDNEGELFKSEQVSEGANSLAYAVGATASYLAFIKAIQTGKPLPIVTTGVNTLVALQNMNGRANTVLSGTGAALSTLTSLYSLQQSIQAHNTLGTLSSGAQATRQFLTHSMGMNVSASNENMWRTQA